MEFFFKEHQMTLYCMLRARFILTEGTRGVVDGAGGARGARGEAPHVKI